MKTVEQILATVGADRGALHVYAEWDTGGSSVWLYAAVCGVALVARIRIRGTHGGTITAW